MKGSLGKMVQNNSRIEARMSYVTKPLPHFLEWLMPDALEEHNGKVSIGGSKITNLRFADDTNGLAEEEQKLKALV